VTGEPVYEMKVDRLPVSVYPTNEELGEAAALEACKVMRQAVSARGTCAIIIATGNSQISFLHALRGLEGIDWSKVDVFHMDEYIGIDPEHPASFPLFLRRHIIDAVKPGAFYPVPSQPQDVEAACREYQTLLESHPADLCVLGIGENGHLAFNDPPHVDFDDPVWVKVVELAEASRRQQVHEGHFASLEQVPTHAITLTIPALLAAKKVLAVVPEARKAEAVFRALNDPISPLCPATILRRSAHAHLYLDSASAQKVRQPIGQGGG
jgi:glucosamine-6-phosphate deaminase